MSRTRKSKGSQPKRTNGNQRSHIAPWTLLAIAVVMGSAAAIYAFKHWQTTLPPTVEMEGVDLAIAEAIERARHEVLASPRSADSWGLLGMTLFAHDFTAPAAVCFAEAERLSPTQPRWPYLHARCMAQVDAELTKSLLEHCVTLCADGPDTPRLFLIELLLEEHELDAAESHLRELLQHDPTNARARHAEARLHFMREDYQACKDGILAFLNGVRRRYDAAKLRVQSLMKQGRGSTAKAELSAANKRLQHDLSKQKTLSLLLVGVLRELGESDNAEKQRQLAVKQSDAAWADPLMKQVGDLRTGLKTMLSKADLAYAGKRYEESISILMEAIAKYPDSVFTHVLLGRAYIRTGRIAQIEQADKQQARDRYIEAERQLRQALSIDPNSVEAQFRLAVSLGYLAQLDGDLDRLSEAESWYRKAIAIKPDFTMAYYNLADCLDKQGRLDDAIEAMRGTIRCEPNHVQGRSLLGGLLMRAGRFEEAEKHLRLAIQLDSQNQYANKLLQQIVKKSGTLP